MTAVMKTMQASAALEIKGRQKAASILWRRRHLRLIKRGRKLRDYEPK
jgi:hypothetical protein